MEISSTSAPRRKARLGVEFLEDRTTPTFLTQPLTGGLAGLNTFNGVDQPFGGLSIAAGDLYPDNFPNQNGAFVEAEYVVAFGPGPESMVGIFGRSGNLRNAFVPFPGFTGGLNVAVGDVLGDSQSEIIVAAASGPPVVGVFTPQGRILSGFFAFSPLYTGGLNIAVGNVQDGITAGGYNSGYTTELADAYQQQFGVRPANQFKQEIIIGTATLSSRVLVTDGSGNVLRNFFAFDPLYNGGVTLAAGSVDKRRDSGYAFLPGQSDTAAYDEIIVGAASFAPLIRVYSTWQGGVNLEQNFFAYPAAIGLGVNVAASNTDNIRGAEIYVNLLGTSVLRTFDGETQERLGEVQVYPPNFSRVLNMTGGFFFGFGFLPASSLPPGTIVPDQSAYDPTDDLFFVNTFGIENPFFAIQDIAVVAGDGPFFQQPRIFSGGFLTPAPFNGP